MSKFGKVPINPNLLKMCTVVSLRDNERYKRSKTSENEEEKLSLDDDNSLSLDSKKK